MGKRREKDGLARYYQRIDDEVLRLIYVGETNSPYYFRTGISMARMKEVYQIVLGEFPSKAPDEEKFCGRAYDNSVNYSEFYWEVPLDKISISDLEKRGFTPYTDWEAMRAAHEFSN